MDKNPVGRPTKYDPSFIQTAKEYIASCGREQTELPTIEGLAVKLDVDDDQINEWSKKYPDFHATIKALKHKQKNQLINDGLYGGKDINATMAIFLLKVNHGMIETERRLIGGDKENPLAINIQTYGNDDPLKLLSREVKQASDPRFKQQGEISSPQLAPESTKNNLSDKPVDTVG